MAQWVFTPTPSRLWAVLLLPPPAFCISLPGHAEGVPANTCMAAHPGEGVGMICAMRIKMGTKRSNLDLTSTRQLKFNI